jgi:hypothetical protein
MTFINIKYVLTGTNYISNPAPGLIHTFCVHSSPSLDHYVKRSVGGERMVCTTGGMTNQRDLRIIYPNGDVPTTNLLMQWPVTETWPATKQPPKTLKPANYEVLQLYCFLPFPCSDA